MRQPQASMVSAGSRVLMVAAMAEPSSRPPATLACWKLPKKPRRPFGAHSTMKAVDPPHSPPAAKPWASRHATSRIGARMPMLS
jgi:hypothetical protein